MSSLIERGGLSVGATDETPGPVNVGQPSQRWLSEVILDTLEDEGVANGRLDLTLIEAEDMAALNAEQMGHDGPTDVLSFPLDADEPDVDPGDGPVRHLGDLVICPSVAVGQAPDHAGTVEAEFALLTIHGVLHVLGHDHAHPDEELRMIEHETRHLARYGFAHPGRQSSVR